jgi:hypothetical protein
MKAVKQGGSIAVLHLICKSSERFRPLNIPCLFCVNFARLLAIFSHITTDESGQARRLNRRHLASGLGTVPQPASQVPSSRHSGFNGTNGNRHPGSSVLSPTSLSANPSLHFSIRLKNNVPEKVKIKFKRFYLFKYWEKEQR